MDKGNQKNLYIISGPSGAGKTTIYKKLLTEYSDLNFSVSVTTRNKREKEKDGKDYYFVDEKDFKELKKEKAFAEWAVVHNNYYGTLKSELSEKTSRGEKCVLDVDVQGAKNLKKLYKHAVFIFIAPPNIQELKDRLKKRKTESDETLKIRIKNAVKELEEDKNFDYVIVNNDIDHAYNKIKKIIIY